MTDEPLIPEYLRRQIHEVEVVETHLSVCVSDRPGGPVDAYIADPGCEERDGIGVLIRWDVILEGEAVHAESNPSGHPALENEQWSATWPRDRSLNMLKEWCSFELHTVVVDTGESPLEDDELEE